MSDKLEHFENQAWKIATAAGVPDTASLKSRIARMFGQALAADRGTFIDDHGTTCDCCQHVMIDATAAMTGERQHCVAGDPEGEGSACAHGWHSTYGRNLDRIVEIERQLAQALAANDAAEAYILALRQALYAGKPEVRERAMASLNELGSRWAVAFAHLPDVAAPEAPAC